MENEENVREKTQPRCQTGDSRIHSYTLTTIRVSSVVITQVKVLGFENSESLILISINLTRVLCDFTHGIYF